MTSIFSTYSTGENRVTASILAVLKSLTLSRIERLLGAMLEQSELELVRFQNQPSRGASGVPDALIQSSFRLLIETKTARGTVNKPQLERHLARLDDATEQTQVLLVLTPDGDRPPILDKVDDKRLAWASFATLDQAIDELLGDPHEVVSEREAFLLRELQAMFEAEGLLANPDDVVIVAARNAWPEYNKYSAYICQLNRGFRPVSRIGFYSRGAINPLVPKILDIQDGVLLQKGAYKGKWGKLVDQLVEDFPGFEGQNRKIFILSEPDSEETLKLPAPVLHDKPGIGQAFTMGQRYVSTTALLRAKVTSDLD